MHGGAGTLPSPEPFQGMSEQDLGARKRAVFLGGT